MTHLNMRSRTLGIMDNLPFLRSLNNECIDLIAIDPPFAANETFTGSPRPPITDAEIEEEKALAEKHGVEHDARRVLGPTGRSQSILPWTDVFGSEEERNQLETDERTQRHTDFGQHAEINCTPKVSDWRSRVRYI